MSGGERRVAGGDEEELEVEDVPPVWEYEPVLWALPMMRIVQDVYMVI